MGTANFSCANGRRNPDLRRGGALVIVVVSQQQQKGGDPVSHCLMSAPHATTWISAAQASAAG